MKHIQIIITSLFLTIALMSFSQDFPTRGEIYNNEVGDVFHKIEKYLIDYEGSGSNAFIVDSTIKIITVIDKYFFNDSNSVAYLIHRNLQTFSLDYNGDIVYTNSYENEYEVYYHDLQLQIEGDTLIQHDDLYNGRLFVIGENSWVGGGGNEEYYNFGLAVVGCGLMTYYSTHYIWSNDITFINDNRIVYYKKGEEEWGEPQVIVGLNEINTDSGIQIYPNPASDNINISAKEKSSIQIYNSTGQFLLSQETSSSNIQLDVSFLPAGVYLVNFADENGLIYGQSKFLKL